MVAEGISLTHAYPSFTNFPTFCIFTLTGSCLLIYFYVLCFVMHWNIRAYFVHSLSWRTLRQIILEQFLEGFRKYFKQYPTLINDFPYQLIALKAKVNEKVKRLSSHVLREQRMNQITGALSQSQSARYPPGLEV